VQAKQEGAEIQWGDDTGLRSDDVRGRGYVPKGKTPVVLANANRSKLSVISTMTCARSLPGTRQTPGTVGRVIQRTGTCEEVPFSKVLW
jgi:hypothetical protein